MDGFKRDGRRPSQYAAALNEKTKDVTLDDIKKEMMLRELPSDIRQMLQERIEKLSFKEAAEIADAYFDQDGQPFRKTATSSVNEINYDPGEEQPNNDAREINAINGRFRQQRSSFQPQTNKPLRPCSKSRSFSRANANNDAPKTSTDGNLCFYHEKYGDKARNCQEACSKFDAKRFPGNGSAGRK